MIPLKSDDIERAVVRKDHEVKSVSGKRQSSVEDVSEITKLDVVDEDHPGAGKTCEDETRKEGADATAVKFKILGKPRKEKSSKVKVSVVTSQSKLCGSLSCHYKYCI